MAERVLVVARGNRRTPVLMDARLARNLVAKGSFSYADKQMTAEPAESKKATKPAKKRVYKRRDMTAEGDG